MGALIFETSGRSPLRVESRLYLRSDLPVQLYNDGVAATNNRQPVRVTVRPVFNHCSKRSNSFVGGLTPGEEHPEVAPQALRVYSPGIATAHGSTMRHLTMQWRDGYAAEV